MTHINVTLHCNIKWYEWIKRNESVYEFTPLAYKGKIKNNKWGEKSYKLKPLYLPSFTYLVCQNSEGVWPWQCIYILVLLYCLFIFVIGYYYILLRTSLIDRQSFQNAQPLTNSQIINVQSSWYRFWVIWKGLVNYLASSNTVMHSNLIRICNYEVFLHPHSWTWFRTIYTLS